ncbi:cryptochrome/photolyase family protein [Pontibacter actiniarum]|uniref:Deoxyribodipyrimidine photo-lyase n=1 Tax=Pontibacter actiniarum TaxID=323450 RepID=A0A1X9YRC2_9BACT|nr:deoxyribodipyrimidine photo-lyase [Pontibacter actiniarum]ARS35413.1 deoxyribodipyrimidine photo-lyase [Pontibacter actiniarum]
MLLFWFRRDLRLHDNAGLFHALTSGKLVLPLFILDSAILDKLENGKDARVTFIYNTLLELHRKLEAQGSTLLVRHGKPLEVFKELMQKYNVEAIYTNRDYEPYARHRDQEIARLAQQQGVAFQSFKDQVIMEPGEIMTLGGTPYKVYTPFKNAWKKAFTPTLAASYPTHTHFGHFYQHPKTPIPALQDVGFALSDLLVPRADFSANTLQAYEQTRNLPAKNATSHLGPHLRFGTVSVREAVRAALEHSDVWLQELIWREFFLQLLFHFPESAAVSFAPKFRHIVWRNNEEEFEKWCEGKTGFPLVDAGMRELNATGFMHNRVRMVVASFLVKDLLIDWRWGEAFFAEKLLDYDMASNVGNWQWAAGTGADAQPYFRIFNPTSQAAKFDPEQAYIKRWVPEFGTAAYPQPMVDHSMARDRAVAAYKKAIALTEA